MSKELFKEGGPHNIRKRKPNEYTMNISLPNDSDGRIARECPSDICSPGYFKVKTGTGITENQEVAFCPYCRFNAEPTDFHTKEQLRYAKDIVVQEAHDGIEKALKDALGLGSSEKKRIGGDFLSIELSYKSKPRPHVKRPFEEDVRRDIICPNCGLDHSVYGLATWCADCGEDIFLIHVEVELNVVRIMLSDIDRRRGNFGVRVAAKDLENCLEDVVSIFEAVMRALTQRHLFASDATDNDVERFFKKIGNSFQNVRRAEEIFLKEFNLPLFDGFSAQEIDELADVFEKRHPITHNLGIVDKKYIERARTAEKEGREVLVTVEEIGEALDFSLKTFRSLHERLFIGKG